MQITAIERNNKEIALVRSDLVLIQDVQSALDLMATVRYETGCDRIVIEKAALADDFFQLSTRLRGEIFFF